ncbi:glutathione S-transferase-like [Ischnura elegans]|uniref:glutathione S-transferase-like n=1 Tax=Ischnura elegans TaxID=197161 RepID=UPI001ED8B683|nr:glutathione S-transferase-like [Ischnura elegans]
MAHTYKLSYFDLMGLGEAIRFLLSYGGAKFEDFRFARDQWPALKNSMPYGKVPVLEIDGKATHQSIAICRYLAKQFKLMGGSDWEDLQCDMIVDTVTDFRMQAARFFQETDEKKKEEIMKSLIAETVPYYMSRFDAQVKKNGGHFVNGKLTWADIYVVAVFQFLQKFLKVDFVNDYTNMKALQDKVLNLPAIKSWVEKRPKTDM